MKCEDIQLKISFYLDGELDQSEFEQVAIHVKECSICNDKLIKWQSNDHVLTERLKTIAPSKFFVSKVVKSLDSNKKVLWKRILSISSVIAAAAVLLFAVVFIYINSQTPPPYDINLYGPQVLNSGRSSFKLVVNDKKTGQNLKSATASISLRTSNKSYTLGNFQSDTNGLINCSFTLPEEVHGKCEITANTPFGNLSFPITIKRDFKILLTTDKPVYQPDQIIHMRTLSLATFNMKPVKQKKMLFEAEDSKGNKVFKKEVTTSDFGLASCDFQLADEINMGNYRIKATIDDVSSEKIVDVKKYVLPKFKVDVTTEKGFYKPGEKLKGFIKSDYIFGKPVSDADVEVTLSTFLVDKLEQVGSVHEKLDKNGLGTFEIQLENKFFGTQLAKGEAVLNLSATVTDNAQHKETKTLAITVSNETLKIYAVPESGAIVQGVENIIYVMALYPDGSPAEAEIMIERDKISTDKSGIGKFSTKAESISYRAKDCLGNTASGSFNLAQSTNTFVVRTDKASYKGSETIHLLILSSVSGNFYIDAVKSGQTLFTKSVEVKNGKGELLIDIPADLFGTVQLNAYKIHEDGHASRDSRIIFVDLPQGLVVKPTFDKNHYKPGEKISINFLVVDGKGTPVQAALGLAAVDEAVFAIQENRAGLEKIYFALEQDLLKPRYQIKGCPSPEILVNPPQQQNEPQIAVSITDTCDQIVPLAKVSYGEEVAKLDTFKKSFNESAIKIIGIILLVAALPFFGYTSYIGISVLFRNINYTRTLILSLLLVMCAVIHPGLLFIGLLVLVAFIFCNGFETLAEKKTTRWISSVSFISGIFLLVALFAAILTPGYLSPLRYSRASLNQEAGFFKSESVQSPVDSNAPHLTPPELVKNAQEFRIRRYFPETLLWRPELITNDKGEASLVIDKPADSITTWRMITQAVSRHGEIGSREDKIVVFQDFFVDIDLPVALTQNDEISIPVAVYNYLKTSQDIAVRFEQSPWFDLLEQTDVKEIKLAASQVGVFHFRIKVRDVGFHKLTVFAASSSGLKDAIERTIQIVPDGKEFEINITNTLNKTCGDKVFIPENAIKGGTTLVARLYPSKFSEVVTGLEGLVRLPYG